VAIIVANIVPALFTMHSVGVSIGGFVEDLFDDDITPVKPDAQIGTVEYVTVGEPFLWEGEWTAVYEVTVDEQDGYTALQFMADTPVEENTPQVCYYLPDGTEVYALCDTVTLQDDGSWLFEYTLSDRMPSTDFWAVFSGESEDDWRETHVLLSSDAEYIADGEEVNRVGTGQLFVWWDHDASVKDVSIHESGSGAVVELTMFRADAFDEPTLYYITESGFESMASCQEVTDLGFGTFHYYYHVSDRQPGSECYISCSGYNDGQFCDTQIWLTENSSVPTAAVGESVTVADAEITVRDVQYETSGKSTAIQLSVERTDDFFGQIPTLSCRTTDGEEKVVESTTYWSQNGVAEYTYKVKKLDQNAPIYAVFIDSLTGDMARVLLND